VGDVWYWTAQGNRRLLEGEAAQPGMGYWIYSPTAQTIWGD